jgi:hypothetical protein
MASCICWRSGVMTISSEKQGTFPDFQGNRFSESTKQSH